MVMVTARIHTGLAMLRAVVDISQAIRARHILHRGVEVEVAVEVEMTRVERAAQVVIGICGIDTRRPPMLGELRSLVREGVWVWLWVETG